MKMKLVAKAYNGLEAMENEQDLIGSSAWDLK